VSRGPVDDRVKRRVAPRETLSPNARRKRAQEPRGPDLRAVLIGRAYPTRPQLLALQRAQGNTAVARLLRERTTTEGPGLRAPARRPPASRAARPYVFKFRVGTDIGPALLRSAREIAEQPRFTESKLERLRDTGFGRAPANDLQRLFLAGLRVPANRRLLRSTNLQPGDTLEFSFEVGRRGAKRARRDQSVSRVSRTGDAPSGAEAARPLARRPVGRPPGRALQREPTVIPIQVLSSHDSIPGPIGRISVGDSGGASIVMDIIDAPSGGYEVHWFNFYTGEAVRGSPSDWGWMSMADIGFPYVWAFSKLGHALSPAEWRKLWPNPVPEILRRYEANAPEVADEVMTGAYRGMVEQEAIRRLAANEQVIDGLLADKGKVERLEEYARGLKEAAIIRERLIDRRTMIEEQITRDAQSDRPRTALDANRRLQLLAQRSDLEDAINFWEAAFPLTTRLPASVINAGRVEAQLREIKSNIVVVRAQLAAGKLDPWDLAAVRPQVDTQIGTRGQKAVAAEDKSQRRWAIFKGSVQFVAAIALLFVPGGAFADALMGAAIAGDAWAEAKDVARAANTGLSVDDGLMTQEQADRARSAAVLATIFAVVGAAASGFRLLKTARLFAALGEAMPGISFAARARLARILVNQPEVASKLIRLAQAEKHVLPALNEALEKLAASPVRLRQAIAAIADGYKGPASAAWRFGLHPDAIAALENATPGELEELAETLSGTQRADAEEILRQFAYKARKAGRKAGTSPEAVTAAASRLRNALAELKVVRARGFPYGFASKATFQNFGRTVRDALKRYGVDLSEIKIQGSGLHSPTPGDIDVAVLADSGTFDKLAKQFADVANTAGNTKLAKTIAKEAADGKIPYVRFAPREAGFEFGRVVRSAAGDKSVQVSLIKKGTEFDVGPFLDVP
jgi:hypothetical protein